MMLSRALEPPDPLVDVEDKSVSDLPRIRFEQENTAKPIPR